MKRKYIKVISTIAAIITFTIGMWQFIVWFQEKSQKRYEGVWEMTTEVESAELKSYVGMKIDWTLHLSQTDNKLTGTAEKISVNSVKLNFRNRTTLELNGSLNKNRFTLTFIENGQLRKTNGILYGEFSNNKFEGHFFSTASDTKGKITGYRIK